MPYCCKCGNNVTDSDAYCAGCGCAQPGTPGPGPAPGAQYVHGISSRTASLLCYIPIVGWIAAIVVLASARFRQEHNVRFHAFQGLYLFVVWLIVDWVLSPFCDYGSGHRMPRAVPGLMQLAIFGCWIFMIIKISHDVNFKLPILGELAEKSVSEQR
jgi:uncharacterized membrane protein